jgi:hypothetical protein
LDAQILLGFQCQAMFHPKLVELLPSGKALKPLPTWRLSPVFDSVA